MRSTARPHVAAGGLCGAAPEEARTPLRAALRLMPLLVLVVSAAALAAPVLVYQSVVDTPDPVPASSDLVYAITVENTASGGGNGATAVQVVLDLPTGLTYLSASGATCSGTDPVTCSLGAIAASSSKAFTVTTRTGALAGGTSLVTDLDLTSAEIVTAVETSVTTTVQTYLSYTVLSDAPDPVIAGEQLTFTVTVRNERTGAPDNVDGVVLRLPDATHLTFASDTLPGTCSPSGGAIVCPLGDLADNGDTFSGTLTYDVAPSAPDGGTLDQDFDLYATLQPAPGVDGDLSTTVDTEADLAVTLTGPATAVPGTNLVYTVDVENLGPSDAQGVTLDLSPTSPLPTPASVSGGGCVALPCNLGTLAPGTVSVTVTYALPADWHLDNGTGNIVNEAAVSTTTTDPVSGNDSESESTPVEPRTDLLVSISSVGATVTPGEPVLYTVTVQNNGPSSTDQVRVLANPTGLVSPVFLPDEGIFSATNQPGANWTGLDLDPAESAVLLFGAWVSPAYVDPVAAPPDELLAQVQVAVVSPYTDPGPGANSASHSDDVNRVADLWITKDNGLAGVAPNLAVPYTIRVRNLGPSDVKAATVADTFDNLRIASASWVCSTSRPLTELAVLTGLAIDGLDGARRGAVSSDGRHLYVAAETDNGVAVFSRNVATGALTLLEVERDAATLDGTSSVIVSPDGKNVYATSRDDDAVVYFTRDDNPVSATFGQLTRDGAVSSTDLDGAADLAIAPDGRHVYAVATTSKKVVVLTRNLATGALAAASTVSDAVATPLDGVAAVAVTPDGRHVVVASADEDSLLSFTRNLVSGALAIADVETSAVNLDGAGALALSPDGGFVYVTGFGGHTLAVYTRNPADGLLGFKDLERDNNAGVDGMDQPRGVVVSPDGRTVYVAGEGADNAVVIFQRETTGVDQGKVTWLATQSTPDPFGLAISPGGEYLHALSRTGNTLTLYAESGGAVCDGGSGLTLTESVDLPAHSEVVFTATAVVSGSASGTLDNTATVTKPADVDSDPAGTPDPLCTDAPASATNNSCSDRDPIVLLADLVTTKTTPATIAVPGGQVVYTVEVVNNGPNSVGGIAVFDDLTNADLASASWTCLPANGAVCGAPNGSGDISHQVTLPPTGKVTYTVTVTLTAGAAGVDCVSPLTGSCLVNSASATLPAGYVDPSPTDSSKTIQTLIARQADLQVVKEVLTADVDAGDPLQFRITVKNCGPSSVTGATVLDAFPSTYTGVTWTCSATGGSCVAAGGGTTLNETVSLNAGAAGTCAGAGQAVFVTSGTVALSAEGVLSNTAVVSTPTGTSDPTNGNNSSTVSIILTNAADLAIVKDDGQQQVFAGEPIEYTIAVFNNGPENVPGASVQDFFPAAIQNATWTCSSESPPAGTLRKIEEEIDDVSPVDGLAGARAVAVAPDGAHVYAVGATDNAVSVFARDAATGELDFVEAQIDGTGGVEGLAGAYDLALSPDGGYLYAVGTTAGAVAAFKRNPTLGTLDFLDAVFEADAHGLEGARGVAVSPDGEHVYVAGTDTVAIFAREELGTLNYLGVVEDGVALADGLAGAASVAVSPDGEHLYVASATEDAVALFRRDADDESLTFGMLTFVEKLSDGQVQGALTIDRLDGAIDVVMSGDGRFVYVAATDDDAISVFRRNTEASDVTNFGKLTYSGERHQGDAGSGGAAVGLDGVLDITVTADGEHVYAAGAGASAIVVFARNQVTGSLKFLESLADGTTVNCLPVPLTCTMGNADGAAGVAASPDGRHVYLTGRDADGLIAFERDGAPPTFAFIGGHPSVPFGPASDPPIPVRDGIATGSVPPIPPNPPAVVDGLFGASAVASIDNEHVFATGLGDQALASFLSDSVTGQLTFVDFKRDGQGGIDGLEAPTAVAVYANTVYVASASVTLSENALAVFSHDGGGHLTQLQIKRQGGSDAGGTIDGLFGASSVVVSPDGKNVYVASRFPGAVAVFDRDGAGLLTFKEVQQTGVGGVTSLGGAHGVAISTDGAHLYATASVDDAVVVFARDMGANPLTFGRLTQIQVQPNLGGLDRALGIAVSREPDTLGSRNVYVAGHTSDALVVFRRNVDDSSPDWGKLTRLQMLVDGVDDVDGLNGARGVAVSSDGKQVYVAGEDDDALAIFSREEVGGTLVFVEARIDGVGGVDGIDQAYAVAVVREGKHIYVAGLGDSAVAAFARSSASRCTGAGVGDIDDTIDIAAFGQVVYTVHAKVDPAATGTLENVATVAVPTGVADPSDGPGPEGRHQAGICNGNDSDAGTNPDSTNDTCTDIDTIAQRADLEVRKTDGTDVAIPGEELSYTLTVFNRGPSNILDATVTDDLSAIFPDGATWTCVAAPSGVLSFVDSFGEGDSFEPGPVTLAGLDGATDVAFSPDGEHVYATGLASDAVVVFAIDSATGVLSYLQTVSDGVGGVDGLDGAGALVVSPDGAHVYVVGQIDDAVAVFERNTTPGVGFGELSLLQTIFHDPDPPAVPLDQPVGLALSPDGDHLYVAAANSSAITVFTRNADPLDLGNFGLLTFLESKLDGVASVDGLAGASDVVVSADGLHVYATGENDNAVAVFTRNADALDLANFGKLGYLERKVDGAGADGMAGPRALAITGDGLNVYVAGAGESAIAVFVRDPLSGALSFVQAVRDEVGGVDGLAGVSGLTVTPDDFHVYAAGSGEDALVALRREITDNGKLEPVDVRRNGFGAIDRLLGPVGVASSPDGRWILVAGRLGDAVNVFARPTDSVCHGGSGTLLSDVVDIAAGSRIVYTITGVVAADACPPPYPCTGTDLENFAEVTLPLGAVDPDPTDNDDTDSDNLSARVDLEITKTDGHTTVKGLAGATSVAISPQGDHLYATGGLGDGVAVFARDAGSGELEYVGSELDNTDGVDGLNGASWVAISPNGRNVYVTGAADNAVVAFARDLTTGELTYLEREQNGVAGVSGMLAPTGAAVSSDGRHLYVAGRGSSAIAIFARDADLNSPDFGRLEFVGEVPDGFAGVDGLGAVRALVLSAFGEHLYAVGEGDNAVAVFARDAETGELTFLESETDLVGGVTGLAGPRALALSPDGRNLYVASFTSGAVAAFSRDDVPLSATFGKLTFIGALTDGAGGVDGLAGAQGVYVVPDPVGGDPGGQHVYVAGSNDDALAVFDRDELTGALAYVGTAGVGNLPAVLAVTVSPDAKHVYAAASGDDAVVAFERDWDGATGTGDLTFIESEREGDGTVAPGSSITYEILVVNHGPSSVIGARVRDIFPGELENVTFTCQTTGGATCFGGSGDLDQNVNLPVGATVLFLAEGMLQPGITGSVVNTATVTTPSGVIELDPTDNTATDDDTVLSPVADIVVDKYACTDGDPATDCPGSATTELVPGTEVYFRIDVHNDGPSDARGVQVTDVLPEILTDASWTCAAEPIPGLLSSLATLRDGDGIDPTAPRCPLAPPPPPLTALDGLQGARAVELSSDGRNVYVGGGLDDGIAIFHRDLRNGGLEFVGTVGDGDVAYGAACQAAGVVDGLDGLSDLASSPDGLYLYATGEIDDALVVFERDGLAGDLIFRQVLRDGVGGANGLGNVLAAVASPDNKHVYTAAFSDNGVGVFVRNPGTGNLGFDSIKVDGGAQGPLTIDGLAGASDVAIDPSGAHVYAVGATDGGVAVFSRNAANGRLTFLEAKKDGGAEGPLTIDGLGGASGVALDPDGANVYVVGATDGGVAVFARNPGSGLLTFLEAKQDGDLQGPLTIDGLAGATGVVVSPDGEHVYVAGATDAAIAVFARDPATGRLEFLEAAVDGAPGLDGLAGVEALAIPSDGEQVYAAGAGEDALAVLRRQPGSRCTPAGFGDVDDIADVAAGGTVSYTIRALLSPSAVGSLINTATAATAENVADPDALDNASTATIALTPKVELEVVKDDGLVEAVPGTELTYTITITNLGPSDLVGASVLDDFAAELLDPVWTCSASGVLEFVEMEQNGIDGVGGLDGGYAVAASPDPDGPQGPLAGGTDLYVASRQSSAVAHFTRDPVSGELDYVASYVDGVGGIDGLGGAGSLAISPDGLNVYVTGSLDNAVVVFDRDPSDGSLTFNQMRHEGDPGIDGLEGAFGVAVSPDGENVYVTGEIDDTLVVFARDKATGALSFVEREKDGFGGLELEILDGVTALAVTPDGRHVIVAGPVFDKLVVFAREAATGAVDFVGAVQDGVGGVDGLDAVQGLVISPSGQFVYGAGLADDAIAIFDRDPISGALDYIGQVKNGVGGVTGLDGVRAVELAPDGQFLYAAGYNSDALAIFARDGVTGLLTFLEAETDGQGGVDGLDGARSLAATADGRNVYSIGEYDDAIAVFRRFGRGVCGAGGTGDIADLISLAVGARVTYTATATIDPCALGTLANTVDVDMPVGTENLGADSASDVDTALQPYAALSISKSNGVDVVVAGTTIVYSVQVDNAGPSCAQAALVADDVPAELAGVTWTCAAAGGGSCTPSGSDDIAEAVLLPPGATVLFGIVGSLDPAATGTLVNTATVTPEAGVIDADLGDNSATDSDPIVHVADLEIDKQVDPTVVETGTPITFTITVTNHGPSVADDVTVTDFLPAGIVVTSAAGTGWTCGFDASTVTCTAAVLPPGVAPAIVVDATAPDTPGALINTAALASTSSDPVSANDTALAPFTVVPVVAPTVVRLDTVPDHGDGVVTLMETLQLEVTGLVVEFSEDVQDPIGDTDPDDVTNPDNFQLRAAGGDGTFTTAVCGASLGDDVRVPFESVVYDPFADEATLSLPAETRLAQGLYQLLVCGSTTILDLTGNALDGNVDGTPGDDYATYFRVQTENRLARPYWDFATDLGAWTVSTVGPTVIDVTAPDASGFFLSDGLSLRGSTGSATMAVSQCLPVPPVGYSDMARGRARILSASGTPTVRIEYRFFGGPACTGTLLGTGQSGGLTGPTAGWVGIGWILPETPAGAATQRVLFRGEEASSSAFEVQFDDLELFTPLFADDYELGTTVRWDVTAGGLP